MATVSLREFQGEEATEIFQEEKEEEAKRKKEEEQARAAAVPGMRECLFSLESSRGRPFLIHSLHAIQSSRTRWRETRSSKAPRLWLLTALVHSLGSLLTFTPFYAFPCRRAYISIRSAVL